MFKLTKENRDWFVGIKKTFSTEFDMYYLCLIVGIAANEKGEAPALGDLIAYFPSDYTNYSSSILGIILVAEAGNLGISIEEKNQAQEHLGVFIDPGNLSKLSYAGIKSANQYADGGCGILRAKLQKPNHLGAFLNKYKNLINEEIVKNKNFT